MKRFFPVTMIMAVSTGVLLLLAGIVAPTCAQQGRHEKDTRPMKQQHQAKPEKLQQVKPEKPAKQPLLQGQHVQQGEQRGVWQQHRAHSWQAEHRTWLQRGGYNGYWIPEEHFRGQFGQSHQFRIKSLSLEIFGGYPRFQYSGYWFSVVDPWPEYWSEGWYENDDVYIDYFADGYYLYNRRHSGDRIAITVYLN
jgi:hypothetical protein